MSSQMLEAGHDESTRIAQTLQPNCLGMRHAAIHEDGVTRTGIETRTIVCVHGNARISRKILSGARGKPGVQLEPNNTAVWPDHLRNDGRVIACTTAEVKGAVAGFQL